MRSKVSYFSISPVLIRENIKRFWSISVLSFIGYFLSGVLPILLNVNRGMEMAIAPALDIWSEAC